MRCTSAAAFVLAMLALVALPAAAGNCAQYSCSDCIDETFCGWCSSSSTCMAGFSSGATGNGTCSSSNWKYTSSACSGTSSSSTKYYTVKLTSGLYGSSGKSSVESILSNNFGVSSIYVHWTSTTSAYMTFYFTGSSTSAVIKAKNNLDAIVSGTVSATQKSQSTLGFSSVASSYSNNYANLNAIATGLGIILILLIVLPIIGVICCIACCIYCCTRQPQQVVIAQPAPQVVYAGQGMGQPMVQGGQPMMMQQGQPMMQQQPMMGGQPMMMQQQPMMQQQGQIQQQQGDYAAMPPKQL